MGTRRGNSQVDLSQPLVTPPAGVECKANFLWIGFPLPPLSFLGFLPSRLLREFNILLCRLVHKANRETILVRGLRRQGNMVIHLENVRWGMFCAPLFRFRWFMGDRIFRGKLIFLRDDLGLGVFFPLFFVFLFSFLSLYNISLDS